MMIEQASIKIVGRQGTKYKLQCLKEDISKLPIDNVSDASTCLILDAGDTESPVYVFHSYDKGKVKKWYPL